MVSFTDFLARNKLTLAVFFFSSCLAYSAFLHFYPLSPGQDWYYFNSLSLFVRSSYLQLHLFPIQNPWFCGGLDLLTNPQNRIFSPMGVLDLVLAPYLANLTSLWLYSLFGHIGMYLCARHLGLSKLVSVVISILFINSNWFGHHFAVGHITFGSMQLLPLSLYLAFKSQSNKYFFGLCLLHSFFLLDGALYTFVFSLYLITSATLFGIGGLSLKHWRSRLNNDSPFVLCCILGCTLIASLKVIPLFVGLSGHGSELEDTNSSILEIIKAFFWPLTNFESSHIAPHNFGFHELGSYFGLMNGLLVILACVHMRKRALPFLLAMGVWFWVASGWGGLFNPWTLHQLSSFGSLHVQSRLFILFQLLALFLSGFGLDILLRKTNLGTRSLIVLLIFEAFFVRNFPAVYSFRRKSSLPPKELIQSTNLSLTLRKSDAASHLNQLNMGSRHCYEPSHSVPNVNYLLSPNYRGEIYPLVPQRGAAKLMEYLPGRLTVSYEDLIPLSIVEVNTNYLWGWIPNSNEVTVTSKPGNLLRFRVSNPSGKVIFQYRPFYLRYILFCFLLGLVLLLIAFRRNKQNRTPRFNYDAFPSGYYHSVLERGHPVRKAWHLQKFERVITLLSTVKTESLLDMGCFSGTFLSLIPRTVISRQVGVDILLNQINFAKKHFETDFRSFHFIEKIGDIDSTISGQFDAITIIEVIEHLEASEIEKIISTSHRLLKKGGRLIITTPNYSSSWPLVEFLINIFSEVNYEEQHITHFSFWNIHRKLKAVHPTFDSFFELELRTTTHFLSPFLAALSFDLAQNISRRIDHFKWRFPFGNLILVSFRKK